MENKKWMTDWQKWNKFVGEINKDDFDGEYGRGVILFRKAGEVVLRTEIRTLLIGMESIEHESFARENTGLVRFSRPSEDGEVDETTEFESGVRDDIAGHDDAVLYFLDDRGSVVGSGSIRKKTSDMFVDMLYLKTDTRSYDSSRERMVQSELLAKRCEHLTDRMQNDENTKKAAS